MISEKSAIYGTYQEQKARVADRKTCFLESEIIQSGGGLPKQKHRQKSRLYMITTETGQICFTILTFCANRNMINVRTRK